MRMTLARLSLTAVMVLVGLTAVPSAFAQNAPEQVLVDLNLKDADMKSAIQVLMSQAGMKIIFEASDEQFQKVTLNLPKVTAEDALKYICQAAGVYFRKDDNGVYVVSHKKPAEILPTQPAPTPVVPEAKKVYKIRMMHSDAQDVYAQIAYGVVLDPFRGFMEINRFKDINNPSRNAMSSSPSVFLQESDSRGGNQYKPMNAQTITNPVAARNDGASNNVSLPGDSAGQFGGGGQLGGGGGALGGGQGGGLGGGQGQGGGLGGGQGQGQTLAAGGLIPSGITYITFDPNDNSIIVEATEADYQKLLQAVSEFDIAPKQVTVKVEFVTTTSSFSKALGFDWLYSRGTLFTGNTPGTFARAGDPIFLSWQTGNFSTRLRAFLQDGYGRVVASPILRTLNNQPAFVSQGVQTVIFRTVIASIGNGQVIQQSEPIQLTVGTQLALRPRINNDGTVTMYLTPSIQQLGQFRTDPQGNQYPDISFQTLAVVARVKSGDTIALAGFTNKSDNGSTSKFPVLGDLPIIGQFFRKTSTEKNFSELLVFVTPTIIEDDDSGGGIGP